MNIHQLLEHHGIVRNPFAEEDAQTDPVFKEHCITSAYHPVWDKVYGDPVEPATSIVFGPKGSGKTAMRLQIERHLRMYNQQRSDRRVFVIRYDDFNPFLDHFQERLSRRRARKPERVLEAWKTWDHMDAILCLGVTDLIDRLLSAGDRAAPPSEAITVDDIERLGRAEIRDLLLLALSYDQSTEGTTSERWTALRRKLGHRNWWVGWDLWLGIAWTLAALVLVVALYRTDSVAFATAAWLLPLLALLGWLPRLWRWARCQWLALGIRRHMRVGNRETGSLRKLLMRMAPKELASQPLPRHDRTDDRYALLAKLQGILRTLRFEGTIVLIDRVDEPHLMGGQAERMRPFVWALLDNKLLKHPGLGIKLMLPRELYRFVEREDRPFHERARLDKQNVIPDFAWTGQALYDVTRARMRACAAEGRQPEPRELFEDAVSYERLLAAMQSLRVPRHLFRFLYRVLVEHCNKHTDAEPAYQIGADTFESVLAVYARDLELTS